MMSRMRYEPIAVAALMLVSACPSKDAGVTPVEIGPTAAEISEALSAVEHSSGEARDAARMKFLETTWLLPNQKHIALLPRFEALLDSREEDDVWLGVVLVGRVGQPSSLPKLWSVVNAPSHKRVLRMKVISTIASTYRDPRLLPVLRDMIDHDDDPPAEAVQSLRTYVSDPTVVSYLRQLLKNPKLVGWASQVLKESHIAFDPKEAVVGQGPYVRWAEGITIDVPADWTSGDLDGYSKVFRNQRIGAFYCYLVIPLKRSTKAAALRDQIGRRDHLHNDLSREQGRPAPSIWAKTLATDVAEGSYVLRRDGEEFLRRAVFLISGDRCIVVAGEAPKEDAPPFEQVFDRMWPTIRIHAADPEGAAAFNKAISDGFDRAAKF